MLYEYKINLDANAFIEVNKSLIFNTSISTTFAIITRILIRIYNSGVCKTFYQYKRTHVYQFFSTKIAVDR